MKVKLDLYHHAYNAQREIVTTNIEETTNI